MAVLEALAALVAQALLAAVRLRDVRLQQLGRREARVAAAARRIGHRIEDHAESARRRQMPTARAASAARVRRRARR